MLWQFTTRSLPCLAWSIFTVAWSTVILSARHFDDIISVLAKRADINNEVYSAKPYIGFVLYISFSQEVLTTCQITKYFLFLHIVYLASIVDWIVNSAFHRSLAVHTVSMKHQPRNLRPGARWSASESLYSPHIFKFLIERIRTLARIAPPLHNRSSSAASVS